MPSLKELYKKLSDVKIDANSVNLNTDTLESLLSTTQADVALIKSDIANGVYSDVRDGSGNALTSSARGSQRALSVQIVDASGNQVTSFGSSSVSVSNFPSTQPVSGTFWQATQPVSGTITTAPQQGTSVSLTTFTSTASSSSVVSSSSTRKGLTIYNAGYGDLYISAGSTCTTTSFQVKLASGDYWECPQAQVTLAHVGVYATTGTAYVTSLT